MKLKSRANFKKQHIETVIETLKIFAQHHPGAILSTVIKNFQPWIEMEYEEQPE